MAQQPTRPRVAALVVAAGRGTRAVEPGLGAPKQYRNLAGRSVLSRTLHALLAADEINEVAVVIHPSDREQYDQATAAFAGESRLLPPVEGGASRQASVRLGLEALAAAAPAVVLIHDAVRPFVQPASIRAVLAALDHSPAASSGQPVQDTLQRCDLAGRVETTVPRVGLWRAATPQGFRYADILAAHRAVADRDDFTDDAAVASAAGLDVVMVPVPDGNMKLTTPDDFRAAEDRLRAAEFLRLGDVRVGTGYDVHALEPGDAVTLGGVAIPHDARLRGHSDADVALHALTDAVLGALGDGDIGQHFPPSDARWRGAPSHIFLADAAARVAARGGTIAHLDVTIVAEAPKVGSHREAMRHAIAAAAGIDIGRVGVKATTNEGLGFAGRREGIAALATATVRLPFPQTEADP